MPSVMESPSSFAVMDGLDFDRAIAFSTWREALTKARAVFWGFRVVSRNEATAAATATTKPLG